MLKRRFIAGAICPKCEKLDKVVMFDTEDGKRWRECVSCGRVHCTILFTINGVNAVCNKLCFGGVKKHMVYARLDVGSRVTHNGRGV